MIHTEGATLSPGTYAAVIFTIIFAITLIAGVGLIVTSPANRYGMSEGRMLGIGLAVTSALVLGSTVMAMWPLSDDFHHYYRVTGNVTEVNSRLVGDGDSGVSQRFVVRLDPSGELFGIADTRAATLKVGSAVDLRCKREFEFNSVPGWACKWNAR